MDVTEGSPGPHNALWTGLCTLMQMVQWVLRIPQGPVMRCTNSGHVEKYRKVLLSIGTEMGRVPRTSQPQGC